MENNKNLKIVAISDTHNKHNKIVIPECDILIHSGDATLKGHESEVRNFAKWFNKQPAKHKIFIPGNHELIFERNLPLSKTWFQEECQGTLLIHESVNIEGLNIFGSPWTPHFFDWAWNGARSIEDSHFLGIPKLLRELWEQIPENTDILVTHGPPHGILDVVYFADGVTPKERVGCQDLMDRVLKLPNLKYHFFGHIHSSYGYKEFNGKHFYNVAICDERYMPNNNVVVIEV